MKSENGLLEFKQSQFLTSGLHGKGRWIVPITILLGSYNRSKNFLLQSKVERKLGWESKPVESHLNALLRGEIYIALATFGHDKTQNEALQRFQILLNDRNTSVLSVGTRKDAVMLAPQIRVASSTC